MTDWLSTEAIAKLTDTKPTAYSCQRRRLRAMGIPFESTFAGKPLVLSTAVAHNPKSAKKVTEPDWDALNA